MRPILAAERRATERTSPKTPTLDSLSQLDWHRCGSAAACNPLIHLRQIMSQTESCLRHYFACGSMNVVSRLVHLAGSSNLLVASVRRQGVCPSWSI
jgi:hypothetical protein